MTDQTSSENAETVLDHERSCTMCFMITLSVVSVCVMFATNSLNWGIAAFGSLLIIGGGLFGIEAQLKKLVAKKA
jgi:hypothetical protein